MSKLISMTDFVLGLENQTNNIKNMKGWSAVQVHRVNSFVKVVNYANFLKQPLKLEMFVPCNDDGVVLSAEEIIDNDGIVLDEIMFSEYQQAKDKVLFEGLNIDKVGPCYIVDFNDEVVYLGDNDSETIEDLVKYGLKLTENAKKHFYGNR